MMGISSRATNGKVMKVVATRMPGTAKMMRMSCAWSQAPKVPCAPKSSTKIRPETTGETAKGRSIAVVSSDFPRKSNLAMAQAAATPNTAFRGTEIAATSSVSRIAARATGSLIAAA